MKTAKILMVVVITAALISACASMPDDQRTRAEGTAAGAVLGGLLGALIDGERGALIGAAVGAGAGYAVGNEVAKRKAEYASTEDYLDGEAERVAEFNATTGQYNQRLAQQIKALEQEAEYLRTQIDAGTADEAVLQAQRATLREELDSAERLEAALAQELEVQNAILAEERENRADEDPYIQRLESEVAELQNNLETLRTGSTQLARIDQRLSV
ncbi:MAG: glycine zipper 2TM domain-containing protein [Wenzhouxiangellaceae bacterium]|nr:MAG: glycine zipper 2TM domain-containing protein [Wenzhouxiangellaceae bacterium]